MTGKAAVASILAQGWVGRKLDWVSYNLVTPHHSAPLCTVDSVRFGSGRVGTGRDRRDADQSDQSDQ